MTDHTVAAEQARESRGNSIRAAARVPQRVPAGTSHAVAPGSNITACGLGVTSLELFPDITFVNGSLLTRCRDCQHVVKPA